MDVKSQTLGCGKLRQHGETANSCYGFKDCVLCFNLFSDFKLFFSLSQSHLVSFADYPQLFSIRLMISQCF